MISDWNCIRWYPHWCFFCWISYNLTRVPTYVSKAFPEYIILCINIIAFSISELARKGSLPTSDMFDNTLVFPRIFSLNIVCFTLLKKYETLSQPFIAWKWGNHLATSSPIDFFYRSNINKTRISEFHFPCFTRIQFVMCIQGQNKYICIVCNND